jgi:Fic family protein
MLATRDLTLSFATVRRTATAEAGSAAVAALMPADYEALARLLLRAEGVASSYIEGVSAPLADIVLAEIEPGRVRGPAAWIAANRTAVTEAIESAHTLPLNVAALCAWHTTVMTGSPLPQQYVGVVRREQGWIGGTSPLDAALVTPPPELLGDLLADLVSFVNRDDFDPVAQAAVAHAQFELIHPFADGNGRVGRVLISWMLTRRLALVTPPPVSIRLAADRGGYLAGLTMFRLGQHDQWVRWFADVVTGAGAAQRDLIAEVESLMARWHGRLGNPTTGRALRRDALAWKVLRLLPRYLMLTSGVVAEALDTTTRAALNALEELVQAGILVVYTPPTPGKVGRPSGMYISTELLGVMGSNPLT